MKLSTVIGALALSRPTLILPRLVSITTIGPDGAGFGVGSVDAAAAGGGAGACARASSKGARNIAATSLKRPPSYQVRVCFALRRVLQFEGPWSSSTIPRRS